MGCDIHYVIEVFDEINDTWVGALSTSSPVDLLFDVRASEPLMQFKPRDYEFFGQLAGVRRNRSGASPKGLPPNPSSLTLMGLDSWGSDAHSISHCTLREFCEAKIVSNRSKYSAAVVARLQGADPVMELLGSRGYMLDPSEDPPAYRVCYWFDN